MEGPRAFDFQSGRIGLGPPNLQRFSADRVSKTQRVPFALSSPAAGRSLDPAATSHWSFPTSRHLTRSGGDRLLPLIGAVKSEVNIVGAATGAWERRARHRRSLPMDQLYYRCSAIAEDMPIDIAIDHQSLMRLRDTSVVLKCACGQTHEMKVAQLFQLAPELPPLPPRIGGING